MISPHVSAVVFDLDGTLADTASLTTGRRTPWDLLKRWPPQAHGRPSFSTEVSNLPARLLAHGYRVAVVTRSPRAYASTLLHLLGAETPRLQASDGTSVAERLCALAEHFEIDIGNVLYVGDTEDDQTQAAVAGSEYLQAPWLIGKPDDLGPLAELLGRPRIVGPVAGVRLHQQAVAFSPGPVDRAAERLRNGTARLPDYTLLRSQGWVRMLSRHGKVTMISGPAAAARRAPRPPWTDCTDRDWRDLLSGGDVERLLDMEPEALRRRLPDPNLDVVITQRALSGAAHVVQATLAELPADLRDLVAGPASWDPQRALAQDLRDGWLPRTRLEALDALPASQAAAYAYTLLHQSPGQDLRRELQLRFLAAAPPDALACLAHLRPPHYFGLPPQVIARTEYEADMHLRQQYLNALRRWLRPVEHEKDKHALVGYSTHPWGSAAWHWIKDWRGDRSGPNTHLHLLEFPALALAASVRQLRAELVIPVPATQPAEQRPGAVSQRLAARVAELAGLPVMACLAKSDEDEIFLQGDPGASRRFVLIDDQVTRGRRSAASARLLTDHGLRHAGTYTWSASRLQNAPPTGCWLAASGSDHWSVSCPGHS